MGAEVSRCPICDRPKSTARDSERFAAECPNCVPEPGAGQLHQWQGVQKWYDGICWSTAGSICGMLAVDWRARALAAESARDSTLRIAEERDLMARHHAIESADARAALERYQADTETLRQDFVKAQAKRGDALKEAVAEAVAEAERAPRDFMDMVKAHAADKIAAVLPERREEAARVMGRLAEILNHAAPAGGPVTLAYTNYRGERRDRRILPRTIYFGATEWYPEPQWILCAWDVDKGAVRDFALAGFAPAPERGA